MICTTLATTGFNFLGLNGSQEAASGATIAAPFIAVVAVLVNFFFLLALIRQIKQGQQALNESKRSADAANAAVLEAEHARIDAQAPKINVHLEQPSFGPSVYANGTSVHKEGIKLTLPKDNDVRIYVNLEGTIKNEGKSTTKLTFPGGGKFVTDDEDDLWLGGPVGAGLSEYLLNPGDSIGFRWSDSHTALEWADATANPSPPNPRSACFAEIISADSYEKGVFDYAYLEMSGRILQQVEGDAGGWVFDEKAEFNAICYPIRRVYRSEYPSKEEPPWTATYEEWNKTQPAASSTARAE